MATNQTVAQDKRPRPFLITFSGIDGAGKSTQIEALSSWLQGHGLRVKHFAFWDHVAIWPRMRTGVGQRIAAHSRANTAQDSLIPKNHKHIHKWYLNAARSVLYVLDVFQLRRLLAQRQSRTCDVIIFDRYVYDQIATIYSHSMATRIYSRFLVSQTPAPDIAIVLDASPQAAFARKPEYPFEFVRENRQNFLRLQEVVPGLITISEACLEEVQHEIQEYVSRHVLQPFAHTEDAYFAKEHALGNETGDPSKVQKEPTTHI